MTSLCARLISALCTAPETTLLAVDKLLEHIATQEAHRSHPGMFAAEQMYGDLGAIEGEEVPELSLDESCFERPFTVGDRVEIMAGAYPGSFATITRVEPPRTDGLQPVHGVVFDEDGIDYRYTEDCLRRIDATQPLPVIGTRVLVPVTFRRVGKVVAHVGGRLRVELPGGVDCLEFEVGEVEAER